MPEQIPRQFLSCDWGTSRFRLRLVETDSLAVQAETVTDQGVARLGRPGSGESEETRFRRYAHYLAEQAKGLAEGCGKRPLTCVISGMASSSIGMRELPYAALPFGKTGRDFRCDRFEIESELDIVLVSGVSGEENVMRGEETQAIGLAEQIDFEQAGLLILPGTHSKHIRFDGASFLDFKTFMTGELFETLSTSTVLSETLAPGAMDERGAEAFLEGVRKSADEGLASGLFRVRAGALLGRRDPVANTHFLSGLLLGGELAYLVDSTAPVWLAATKELSNPYQLALRALLSASRLRQVRPEQVEVALLEGQRKILALQQG